MQYASSDAQQWPQYGTQPQQQYAEQQPDYVYYYHQQAQQQPQGASQTYPPQAALGPRHHVQHNLWHTQPSFSVLTFLPDTAGCVSNKHGRSCQR